MSVSMCLSWFSFEMGSNVSWKFCDRRRTREKFLLFSASFCNFFFFKNSFSAVLVSISKGQVSTRTIRGLRLDSTHESGRLFCMSKIICSQADIQSKWLKELLAVRDVSSGGKEWKQTRLLRKRKTLLFWTSPCWVPCWPGEGEVLNSLIACLPSFFGWCFGWKYKVKEQHCVLLSLLK